MKRIGLFGGTFDPIHVGHLDVAESARSALRLDQIIVMPANVPPHRASPMASSAHRFAMAALALRGRSEFVLSDFEMLSDEVSYTTTTLDRLAARGVDTTKLFLITGADAFGDIPSWRNYPALLDRCNFVVVSRPGHPATRLHETLPGLSVRMADASPAAVDQPGGPRILLVEAPTAAVSSTDIRQRVADGRSVAGLVVDEVAAYISQHRLYKGAGFDLWKTS
jgi:nicotinate-nucleotide adenylyltransferase